MKNSLSPAKKRVPKSLWGVLGLFLTVYLFRHLLFAATFEGILAHVAHETFAYEKRTWKNGSLIYDSVVLGKELSASQLQLTPQLKFFPPHFALEAYFTEPHLQLSSDMSPHFNFTFLLPTRWSSIKLDLERSDVAIDLEPMGFCEWVSGEENLGTLILFSEEGNPYCTCVLQSRAQDLSYELKLSQAPLFRLHPFLNLSSIKTPVQWQGGLLDADIRGTYSRGGRFACEGTLTAFDLQVATDLGEMDFQRLGVEGQWREGAQLSVKGALQGSLQGTFSADVAAYFEKDEPISLELTNLHLADLQLLQKKMVCDSIKGDATFSSDCRVKQADLQIDGVAYTQDGWNLINGAGSIIIRDHLFQPSIFEAKINSLFQTQVSWEGPVEKPYGQLTLSFASSLLQFQWSLDCRVASFQMNCLPSVVYLKGCAEPIQFTRGTLVYQGGVLTTSQLEANWGEMPIQGDLTCQASHLSFSGAVPGEEIAFAGELHYGEQLLLQISSGVMGGCKLTEPLFYSQSDEEWTLQGGVLLNLEGLKRYEPWVRRIGGWEGTYLPQMQGNLHVQGTLSSESKLFDVESQGIILQGQRLSPIKGRLEQKEGIWKTDNLAVGEAYVSAQLSPEIQKGSLIWKDVKISFFCNSIQFKEGKLEASSVQTTAEHLLLEKPIVGSLYLSWSPERFVFQGPLTDAGYAKGILNLRARDIYALYEKGVLHFQTQLQLNQKPLQAKGRLLSFEEGFVELIDGEDRLQLSFSKLPQIEQIKGSLYGANCLLNRKGVAFEGEVQLKTAEPLALLLNKPEWSQMGNLQATGRFEPEGDSWSFEGEIHGKEAIVQGYIFNELHAFATYHPTHFLIQELQIDDPAGHLFVKEWQGARSHSLKAWDIEIPHIKGDQIQPSLLRKLGKASLAVKPFQMRRLSVTHLKGTMGRPLTFQGQGLLYFTQKEKRILPFLIFHARF